MERTINKNLNNEFDPVKRPIAIFVISEFLLLICLVMECHLDGILSSVLLNANTVITFDT